MNETNGPGAVVPVGLREEIERIARLLGPTNDLPVRMKVSGAYDALMELTVAMDNAAPSPQPAPGSDADDTLPARMAAAEQFMADMAADPHEPSDVDEDGIVQDRYEVEEISLDDLPAYTAGLQDRIANLERQLAEARAEVEALREEVALTNEHEHQILQERNAARDELQTARDAYAELLQETKLTEEAGGAVARAYQERDEALRELAQARAALLAYQEAEKTEPCAWIVETRGGNVIYWTSKERSIAEQVAASYDREAIPLYRHPPRPAPADVMTPSSAPELADLLRKRYPRLLERGNPLYDGALAAAVERAGAADVVTVPREEWEAVNEFADLIVPLRDNLTGISWTGKLVDVFAAYDRWYAVRIRADQAPDALRSSAQAGEGSAG